MNASVQVLKLALKVCLVLSPCQPVHTGCGVLLEFEEHLFEQIDADVVEERGEPFLLLAVCVPAPGTRFPGSAPGACFAGPHSPWPPPLAPPTPQRIAPPCSSASRLLWRSPTSRFRASSATAPRLPDADPRQYQPTARRGTSQVPARSLCA